MKSEKISYLEFAKGLIQNSCYLLISLDNYRCDQFITVTESDVEWEFYSYGWQESLSRKEGKKEEERILNFIRYFPTSFEIHHLTWD